MDIIAPVPGHCLPFTFLNYMYVWRDIRVITALLLFDFYYKRTLTQMTLINHAIPRKRQREEKTYRFCVLQRCRVEIIMY